MTGSAHCALGPYWIARLGRQPLTGRQLSARGGLVRVYLDGGHVLLGGEALVVAEGVWRVPVTSKVIVYGPRQRCGAGLAGGWPGPRPIRRLGN